MCRPPASVHPEPGSNSPLYVCLDSLKVDFFGFFLLFGCYLYVKIFFTRRNSLCRLFRFASAKVLIIFNQQTFWYFFQDRQSHLFIMLFNLIHFSHSSALPHLMDCKVSFFQTSNIFLKYFYVLVSVSFFLISLSLLFRIAKGSAFTIPNLFTTFLCH